MAQNQPERCMKFGSGAEKAFDMQGAPSNHAYPEKIRVLSPNRAIECKGRRQHRPVVQIPALHALFGRLFKIVQLLVFQGLDVLHQAIQNSDRGRRIQTSGIKNFWKVFFRIGDTDPRREEFDVLCVIKDQLALADDACFVSVNVFRLIGR